MTLSRGMIRIAFCVALATCLKVPALASSSPGVIGHGPPFEIFSSVSPSNEGFDCIRHPANPTAAWRIEDLKDFIVWRFQEEYDPWFRDDGVLLTSDTAAGHRWSRSWLGGLDEIPTEVFEFPTGAEIVHFDTGQTLFAKEHVDIPLKDVPQFIDDHARIVCNGNFVLFFVEYDHFDEKEKREVELFARFFKEFTPQRYRHMKVAREALAKWTDWFVRRRFDNYEDALTGLADRNFPPAGHPELYAELKEVENEIAARIEHFRWLRELARGQILKLARLRDINDLLAWREYDRIAEVGDFETLRQLYDLSRSDGPDSPLLRSAVARLMIRLPGEDFDTVPIEFVPEFEHAIRSASKRGELDPLWRSFGNAERVSVHEIRVFRDCAVVEARFSKDLGRASFTSGGAWLLLDRSDPTCTVCEILDTWTH